jgi:hypothetical protein
MKLTTKQLKQMIKEELEGVLDEGLADVHPDTWLAFYNGCMNDGVPQLDIEANDGDRCLDVASQIKSGNYDDDVVMAYMKHEYGDKQSPKSPKTEPDTRTHFTKMRLETEWRAMNHEDKMDLSKKFLQAAKIQQQKIRNKKKEIQQEITRLGGNPNKVSEFNDTWDRHYRWTKDSAYDYEKWHHQHMLKTGKELDVVEYNLVRLMNKEMELNDIVHRLAGIADGIGSRLPLNKGPNYGGDIFIDWVMENISLWDEFRERRGL